MDTSQDEFIRGGGGSPPCIGLTSSALPEATIPKKVECSDTGVSTRSVHTRINKRHQLPYWHVMNGETVIEEENRLTNIFFAYGTFDNLKR